MTRHELFLYWLCLGFPAVLCVLVYLRGAHRRLPLFSAHAAILVAGTIGVQIAYQRFGFRSAPSYYAAWIAATVIILSRFAAIVELCRHGLREYRGVWALTWRVLAGLAAFLFAHAAVDAWGQPNWIAVYGLTIERDIAITSFAILVSMLAIRNYYGLRLEPLQKWVAVGMCFVCAVDVVNNAMLRDLFMRHMASWAQTNYQIERANDVWNAIRTSALVVSIGVWCFALRKPLPAKASAPALLPDTVYRELSPAVNLRLRAFNSRLMELLKS